MSSINPTSPTKTYPPLSPSKRGAPSNRPNSETKRVRQDDSIPTIAKAALVQNAKKSYSARDIELKERIDRMKAKQKLVARTLSSYIKDWDIDGLKAAFNPLHYQIDNPKGIEDLKNALEMIDLLDDEYWALGIAFAELLIQIEDLEVLADDDIQEFFKILVVPKNHPSALLCLLCGSRQALEQLPPSTLAEYRSPIKKHSLLHYAAICKATDLYLWLIHLNAVPQKNEDGQSPITLLFEAIGRSNDKPADLASFFNKYFRFDIIPEHTKRVGLFCIFLQEAINRNAIQLVPLLINQMERWKGDWKDWKNEIIPSLKLKETAICRMALLWPRDENFTLDSKDSQDRTLLHWAIVLQNIPLIKELLKTTLAHESDLHGRTALHYAASVPQIDPDILRLLTEHNPKATLKKDYLGHTPLEIALNGHIYENFRALCRTAPSKPGLVSPCLWYAAANDAAHFKAIVEKDKPFSKGLYALHVAIALGHSEIVRECLQHPIFWHIEDKFGYMPLTLAVQRGDNESIDRIMAHRALFEMPSNKQEAIDLIQLSFKHPMEIDRILGNLPLDTLETQNENGLTPLQLAEIYGGTAVSYKLVDSLERVKKIAKNPAFIKPGTMRSGRRF